MRIATDYNNGNTNIITYESSIEVREQKSETKFIGYIHTDKERWVDRELVINK